LFDSGHTDRDDDHVLVIEANPNADDERVSKVLTKSYTCMRTVLNFVFDYMGAQLLGASIYHQEFWRLYDLLESASRQFLLTNYPFNESVTKLLTLTPVQQIAFVLEQTFDGETVSEVFKDENLKHRKEKRTESDSQDKLLDYQLDSSFWRMCNATRSKKEKGYDVYDEFWTPLIAIIEHIHASVLRYLPPTKEKDEEEKDALDGWSHGNSIESYSEFIVKTREERVLLLQAEKDSSLEAEEDSSLEAEEDSSLEAEKAAKEMIAAVDMFAPQESYTLAPHLSSASVNESGDNDAAVAVLPSVGNVKVETSETLLATANAKIKELTASLATANAKIKELTTSLATANGDVQDLTVSLTSANAKIKELATWKTDTSQELTASLATAKAKIKELETCKRDTSLQMDLIRKAYNQHVRNHEPIHKRVPGYEVGRSAVVEYQRLWKSTVDFRLAVAKGAGIYDSCLKCGNKLRADSPCGIRCIWCGDQFLCSDTNKSDYKKHTEECPKRPYRCPVFACNRMHYARLHDVDHDEQAHPWHCKDCKGSDVYCIPITEEGRAPLLCKKKTVMSIPKQTFNDAERKVDIRHFACSDSSTRRVTQVHLFCLEQTEPKKSYHIIYLMFYFNGSKVSAAAFGVSDKLDRLRVEVAIGNDKSVLKVLRPEEFFSGMPKVSDAYLNCEIYKSYTRKATIVAASQQENPDPVNSMIHEKQPLFNEITHTDIKYWDKGITFDNSRHTDVRACKVAAYFVPR
jgi:hypothetical protein